MECVTITNNETTPITEEDKKLKNSDSVENFQHFIYELFEKNGILNDLRAYLRGHIVDVLKSAQKGEPPTCQKHFTQRLELTNQALNILVAEYLLRYEFSYSLSVFISEIPLANMVFGLAKTLMMQSDCGDTSNLWFSDSDVWSVLNYLGVKCDSVHATNIVEKYNRKESPLLLCILKSLPFYCRQDISQEQEISSIESVTSEKSSESLPEKHSKHQKGHRHEKCKHYVHCKVCQSRLHSVKEKYIKKKKYLAQHINIPPENTQNVESLVKNVSFAEKALVDEMFHQLKNVYETEVEMVKQEEEKKYKQVLAKFAVQLQKRQAEMEEKFKQREEELENAVQQKKKFLWGLAQSLRDQHQNMAAAMSCVRGESERLTAKEDNLKTQLIEAETMIKNRGEEMRAQISNEILVLEERLESMKKERDSIDREKLELEKFKTLCDSKIKLMNDESQIEILRKDIVALKKFVEESKICVVEKCTMTDSESGGRMNNQEVGMKSDGEERGGRTPNQVVNDLKKQKNVNFNQSQFDTMYQDNRRERIRSHSTEGLEERDARRDAILILQDENDRLKHFARQQEQHIDELTLQSARLQASLEAARLRARPRTAPACCRLGDNRVNTSISATYNTFARSLGAGEDGIFIARNVPRDDTTDRQDSRRYLIQQWRALRRSSPARSPAALHPAHGHNASLPSACHSVDTEPMRETAEETNYCTELADQEESPVQPMPEVVSEASKARCKSPKSMLKEAKMKLRNKNIPRNHPQGKREKSPTSVLREAKLRLRKLEIEAEAVEKSYLDFRKRQTMKEENRCHYVHVENGVCNDVTLASNVPVDDTNLQKCKRDLDNFLNNYEKRFNISGSQSRNRSPRNRSPNEKAKVIPESYVELDKNNVQRKDNTYLETPLTEFRKLYSQKPSKLEPKIEKHTKEELIRYNNNDRQEMEEKTEINNKMKESLKNDKKELQILKDNINKIYNLEEPSEVKNIDEVTSDESNNPVDNLLRIEIETVTKANNLKLSECGAQDMLLVVQSPVKNTNISDSNLGEEFSPRMTVIVSPKVIIPTEEAEPTPNPSLNIPVRLEPEKLNPDSDDTLFLIENDEDEERVPVERRGGSRDIIDSLSDRDKADDYVDDFSADVDNYNSRSEYEDNSPVSHLKTSEDENFWDS